MGESGGVVYYVDTSTFSGRAVQRGIEDMIRVGHEYAVKHGDDKAVLQAHFEKLNNTLPEDMNEALAVIAYYLMCYGALELIRKEEERAKSLT